MPWDYAQELQMLASQMTKVTRCAVKGAMARSRPLLQRPARLLGPVLWAREESPRYAGAP